MLRRYCGKARAAQAAWSMLEGKVAWVMATLRPVGAPRPRGSRAAELLHARPQKAGAGRRDARLGKFLQRARQGLAPVPRAQPPDLRAHFGLGDSAWAKPAQQVHDPRPDGALSAAIGP